MLETVLIAKRTEHDHPDTDEIRELTEAAGANVVGEVTQRRASDPGTEFGAGKVDEIARLVSETGADTVVVDAELTPQQTVTLEDEVGASVVDRHRVVLEIFAEQARTRRAQLQVELARLRYRLPRVRERSDEGMLNRLTESGTPYYDMLDRIDELERKLDDVPSVAEQHRKKRREQGFDLVAIAGYTNAGKSTLLHRLADDLQLDQKEHADLDETAAVEDRLFKTLETTTRRATLDGRPVLLTDTVGFLDDLPHWLVESFRNTLTAVENADAIVLVADFGQSSEELRRRLETVHETLPADHPPVVTAFNKVDLVAADERTERLEAVTDLTSTPICISARHDETLDELEAAILDALPSLDCAELSVPLSDDAMSLLSWLHDEAVDVDVTYEANRAIVDVTAKSETIARARARVDALAAG